jgi:HK97 family phage prohead protease
MTYEFRTADMWPEADFEMRASSDGMTFDGYAAVFDLPSLSMQFPGVGGGKRFREVIVPGAFTRTLAANPDVLLLWQHDMTALPLGRTRSGTLSLEQDGRGLRARATLPDNEWGRPVRDAIARGDVSGMSFRFAKVEEEWQKDTLGSLRLLREVKIGPEVSIANSPAYPDTVATVRALAEEIDADPDELLQAFRILRDPDVKLTSEQHGLLQIAINAHADEPFVGPKLARARERLAAIAS